MQLAILVFLLFCPVINALLESQRIGSFSGLHYACCTSRDIWYIENWVCCEGCKLWATDMNYWTTMHVTVSSGFDVHLGTFMDFKTSIPYIIQVPPDCIPCRWHTSDCCICTDLVSAIDLGCNSHMQVSTHVALAICERVLFWAQLHYRKRSLPLDVC